MNMAPKQLTLFGRRPRRRLPAWAAALGLETPRPTVAQVRSAYRARAHETHPDVGGTAAAFQCVRAAYDAALAAIGRTA